MRGEHAGTQPGDLLVAGSSPRARGAQPARTTRHLDWGIIPACAGSTTAAAGRWSWPGDHPRVRGEHTVRDPKRKGSGGSSPRARGALPALRGDLDGRGIIPACAGSTRTVAARSPPPRDHPRVRGEHLMTLGCPWTSRGSSPRARGAQSPGHRVAVYRGIIPACAGSTGPPCSGQRTARDHPRVRGEHFSGAGCAASFGGSSPRARGARPLSRHVFRARGIIPACAGSTATEVKARERRRDHPRVRGEHV